MNKFTKALLTIGAACALAVTSFAAGNLISISVDPSVKILVNGTEFQPKDANGNDVMTFIYNGTTYAPLRALAEAYGLEVGYDAARNMATVSEPGNTQTSGNIYDTYDTPTITDGMKRALEYAKEYCDIWSRAGLIDVLEDIGFSSEEAIYGVDNCGANWGERALNSLKSLGSYWTYESAYEWLVDYKKYTEDEAEYAINHLPESYFSDNKYSDSDNSSYDKNDDISLGKKNALKKAKDYLDYTAFSYEGLIDQLEYEGYTHEEAVYGADNCGADWYEQAVQKGQDYLDYTSFSRDGLIRQLEHEGFTNAQAVYAVNELGY